MALLSTLFAVFYAGIVLGVFFGLFWRGRSTPRSERHDDTKSMAIDLNANGPSVLCDPDFDQHEDARDFLVRARDAGAL